MSSNIELASVYVPVVPSLQGASRTIEQGLAGVNVTGIGNTIGTGLGTRIASGLGAAAKAGAVVIGTGLVAGTATAAAGIGAILSKGIDRSLNIQDATKKLEGLGHSGEGVAAIMNNALASVRGTAFGLDTAATVAATAVAAGVKPGQDLERYLKLTADAATIAGVSMGEMGAILNKTSTTGKVFTDDLNQLAGRGLPVFTWLQEAYGVTGEELSDMVKKGEVDSATLQRVIEENIGGAALKSGETARGAFANIGAAFGRLGARFTGGGVAAAPALFTSIAGAVDRADEALKPYAERFTAWLVPAMERLGTRIDAIDFGRIVGGLQGVYDLVVGGDFTTALGTAFNIQEDSGFVTFVLGVRDGISGLYELIVNGDFTGALHRAFALEEDSGLVTFILGVRTGIGELISTLGQGDLSGAMSSIGTSLTTLQPAFAEFGAAMPKIGSAVATLASAGITVLAGVLGFLADNVDTIIAIMPLLVGGFIAMRVATAATAQASLAVRAAEVAATPVYLANNIMRLQSVTIERQLAVAKGINVGATNAGALATARSTVATVAGNIATAAAGTATRVAAAGQWLLNAALTANPIGIIIALIVALVAGLIWFFTQTELGKTIVAEFSRFLGEAWANIYAGVMVAFVAITSFLSGFWEGAKALFFSAVAVLVNLFLNWTPLGILIKNFGAIVAFFSNLFGDIQRNVIIGIARVISGFIQLRDDILGTLSGAGRLLYNVGRDIIGGLINGVSDMIGKAVSAVKDVGGAMLDGVKGFLGIKSPSRVFRFEVGQMVGAGFVLGIEDSEQDARRAIEALVHTPDAAAFAADAASTQLAFATAEFDSGRTEDGTREGDVNFWGPVGPQAKDVVREIEHGKRKKALRAGLGGVKYA